MDTGDGARYFAPLAGARYIALTTFRRSGAAVSTPVWFAERDGALYVFSDADAGKVKRLRHTARVTVAPCTATGTVRGPALDARGRIVMDSAEARAARDALARRYGFQWRALAAYNGLMRAISTLRRQADDAGDTYLVIERP
jgi:uncharacterized protein